MFNIMNMFNTCVPMRITRYVLSDPTKEYSARGLAEELKVSPASASKTMKELRGKGILNSHQVGRSVLYRANLESALCRHWKTVFSLEEISGSRFFSECRRKLQNILSIMLYGSRAQGKDRPQSDYDFLVVTATRQKARPDPANFGLPAEANCLVFSFSEWKKHAQKNPAFYKDVMFYGIVLEGERMVAE
ncbi:MAG: nucleotidyltransferase domain-containing protein [Candidatus Micrarchaeia archaeon]